VQGDYEFWHEQQEVEEEEKEEKNYMSMDSFLARSTFLSYF
jgi:hypothetical protein